MDKTLKKYKNNISDIILIQKIMRGYLVRKKLTSNTDSLTAEILEKMLDQFILYTDTIANINKKLKNKKLRMPNFPSEISENIAKYAIYKKYKVCPNWDTKNGDLIINNKYINKKIEIKAFSSKGPTSFGPTEKWDFLYIVDATKYKKKFFVVYEIKLPNDCDIFSNLKLNKSETYKNQCDQKRRPRICFNDLHKQLKDHINIIFQNTTNYLFL